MFIGAACRRNLAKRRNVRRLKLLSWGSLFQFVYLAVISVIVSYFTFDGYLETDFKNFDCGKFLCIIGVIGTLNLIASLSGFACIRILRAKVETPLTDEEMDWYQSYLFDRLMWLYLYKQRKTREAKREKDLKLESLAWWNNVENVKLNWSWFLALFSFNSIRPIQLNLVKNLKSRSNNEHVTWRTKNEVFHVWFPSMNKIRIPGMTFEE